MGGASIWNLHGHQLSTNIDLVEGLFRSPTGMAKRQTAAPAFQFVEETIP
jgi:hypothetical protein